MFPTSGYFNQLNCPFFLSGLCERPYCHFKHVIVEERPSLTQTNYGKSYVPARQSTKPSPKKPEGPVYCPTPIAQLNESRSSVKRKLPWPQNNDSKHTKQTSYSPGPSGSSASGYTPTPIHRLNSGPIKLPVNNCVKPTYSPAPINKSDPITYTPNYSPSPVDSDTTSQYDPIRSCDIPELEKEEPVSAYNPTPQSSNIVEKIDIEESDNDDLDDEGGMCIDTALPIAEINNDTSPITLSKQLKITPEKRKNNTGNIFDNLQADNIIIKKEKHTEDLIPHEVSTVDDSKVHRRKLHKTLVDDKHTLLKKKKKSKHKEKKKVSSNKEKPAEHLSNLFSEIFGDDDSPKQTKSCSPEPLASIPTSSNVSLASQKVFPIRQPSFSIPKPPSTALTQSASSKSVPGGGVKSVLLNASGKKLSPREVMFNRMAQAQASQSNGNSFEDKKGLTSQKSSLKPKTARPLIPATCGTKIPINIRQKYLNQFVEECLKVVSSTPEEAYARALEEEQQAYEKSANRVVYLNSVIRVVKRLREEQKESATAAFSSPTGRRTSSGGGTSDARAITVSHAAVLGGAKAAQGNFGIMVSTALTPLQLDQIVKGDRLYSLLRKYILTEELGISNGFPQPPAEKWRVGEAFLPKAQEKWDQVKMESDLQRTCCRCGSKFKVTSDGEIVDSGECVYHWGKAWKQRVVGQGIEQRYNCCSSDMSQRGCQLASSHVHDSNRWRDTTGFMRTLPAETMPASEDDDQGVYALDCEMVYTTFGCELARVTVIDRSLESVYEKLVLPLYPVVDYNTRFSGLKASDFDDVRVTLADIQSDLLNMFTEKTILIGHSLESDFLALKLIHGTVIDTSVVFPHRQGPPKKRALRNLVAETLHRIIQSDVGGHDSREDAMVCMELMQYKVKEDLKRKKRP